jgi:hypothetical protein
MTDPAPLSNVPLLAASQRLAESDAPAARLAFYQELLRATLLLAVSQPPSADGGLSVIGVQDATGRRGFAVFSDGQAMTAWKKEDAYAVGLEAAHVFALALKAGAELVLLNPAGPARAAVLRADFEALAQGRVPEGGAARVPIGVAPLRRAPSAAVIAALRAAAERQAEVLEAYLFEIGPVGASDRMAFGLLLSEAGMAGLEPILQAVFAEIGPALDPLGAWQCGPLDAALREAALKVGLLIFARA